MHLKLVHGVMEVGGMLVEDAKLVAAKVAY